MQVYQTTTSTASKGNADYKWEPTASHLKRSINIPIRLNSDGGEFSFLWVTVIFLKSLVTFNIIKLCFSFWHPSRELWEKVSAICHISQYKHLILASHTVLLVMRLFHKNYDVTRLVKQTLKSLLTKRMLFFRWLALFNRMWTMKPAH